MASLCILASQAAASAVEDVDRIVAVVDDDVVVRSELDTELAKVIPQLKRKGTQLPAKDVLENQVLERLILAKLQLAAAEQAGINVSEDLLSQAVGNIAQKNGLSMAQFRQALKANGISFHDFREQIRNQVTMRRLQERVVGKRIRVTDREVDAYIARKPQLPTKPESTPRRTRRSAYHILHILVAVPEGAVAAELQKAKEKATEIVKKLRSGSDFKTVALAESDGRMALEGGDLGWRKANEVPTMFAKEVRSMKKGAVSNPIRSPSGFHVIKLKDYKGGIIPKRKSSSPIVNQSRVRHILVKTNEITSDEDAKLRLQQLLQRIKGGDNFNALARSHSDDTASALKGGELGWINPGDMVPEFEQQLEGLAPGQLSQPFRTPFGWHIVQLMEQRKYDSSQEVLKNQAREIIRQRKMGEETELYLRQLRDDAYIEIRLDDM
jgi:peptidyl-prolyl cis-trans isomerase SurA